MSDLLRSIEFRALIAAAALAAGSLRAEPVISEFMASNRATLVDADGEFSDWIEIHNPDPVAVDLSGWALTDTAGSPFKWRFPAVAVPAGGYLVVFASNKNRAVPEAELHTNFALSAGGEYLALIRPDGSAAFAYAPSFPAQKDDVSYGLPSQPGGGFSAPAFLSVPSPGRANPEAAQPPPTERVVFSRSPGPFSDHFALELSGSTGSQVIRYALSVTVIEGDVIPEVTAESPIYREPLLIDSTTLVRAAVFAAEGPERGPIASVLYTKVADQVADFSSNLPLVVLDSLGSGPLAKNGFDYPTWMYVYDRAAGGRASLQGPPSLVTSLETTVRGSSSAEFPKKGYNLKFTDELGGKRSLPLLGMPAHEKWALVAPWKYDPGFVSNSLVYSLSNSMGRWAPRTRLVELFFNEDGDDLDPEDYAGIYVVTDRIEVGLARVAVAGLSSRDNDSPEVTGGYLLKIDNPDPDEFGWVTQGGVPADEGSRVILVAPKADDVTPAQRDYLVNYVQQLEDALRADHATGFAQRTHLDFIDRSSWVDHHILNTFSANPDALERSAYFTKPRGGRLQAGPVWDFDRALGSYEDERSFRWDVWSGYGGADVWKSGWWALLVQDPEFMQEWVDRWQELRRTTFSHGGLVTLAESFASEVGLEAAQRDVQRWPDNQSPAGGYGEQIEHLKGWLTQRAAWIDEQLVEPPAVVAEDDLLHVTPSAGAVLIYTLDGTDPRSLGGRIAPNATVSARPVALPATANFHARSYREDREGVFPGSPWSSAAMGPSSSPLSPGSRVVNLSVRAGVGNGSGTLVGGVTLADTTAKSYLVRAVGPSLANFGATGFLTEPQLTLRAADGRELAANRGWQDGPDAEEIPALSRSVGAFPLMYGGRDAALIGRLSSDSYLVEVTAPSGEPGTGMLELYELDTFGRAINLSVRAYVRPGGGSLVGGFVIQGRAHKRLLLRAVGPTLGEMGVSQVLDDPVLAVYSGSLVVASNDQWELDPSRESAEAAAERVGAFKLPSGSGDAALFLTLAPGAYTIEVSGKEASEGIVLLEIYDVP